MKLAIYTVDGNLGSVYEIKNPKFVGDKLVFDKGEIKGLEDRNIFLNDDETPPDLLDDAKLIDKRGSIPKQLTELEQNQERITDLENALLTVMDLL